MEFQERADLLALGRGFNDIRGRAEFLVGGAVSTLPRAPKGSPVGTAATTASFALVLLRLVRLVRRLEHPVECRCGTQLRFLFGVGFVFGVSHGKQPPNPVR